MTFVAVGATTAAEIAAAATAAEVAAAAVAAETAAATAAAATAAETAAAATAAEAAAATAASQAAAPVAAETAGILGATPEAAGVLGATPETAGILGATPEAAGAEQVLSRSAMPLTPAGVTPPPPAGVTPPPSAGIEQIGAQSFSPAELEAIFSGQADAAATQGTGMQSANFGDIGYTPTSTPPTPTSGPFVESSTGLNVLPGEAGVPSAMTPPAPASAPAPSPFVESSTGLNVLPGEAGTTAGSNSFMQGFEQFAKKNPLTTAAGAYSLASATGMLKPSNTGGGETKEKKQYSGPRLSPNFQGGPYGEPNVYEEKRYNFASGGITEAYQSGGPVERMNQMNMNPQGGLMSAGDGYSYPMNKNPDTMPNLEVAYGMASGGIAAVPRYNEGRLATSNRRKDEYAATQRFLDMYDPQSRYAAMQEASDPRVGIFRDTTAATRNKSALDAAMTRQAALEKQNYVDTGAKLPRASRSAGQLVLKAQGKKSEKDDEYDYARGGITQASLGGYAAGGNPRLLKGPGDGMSDNIPAVIGRRQPARLADGEFVVPADVVSHLGNGSTAAGAKKLHGMMDNVRKARTGKKKQAPAVKTNKFIPK
jgi:hypothetical protein